MTRVDKLEAEIARLLAQIDALPKEWPQVGDMVWRIDASGSIQDLNWVESDVSERVLQRGMLFRTREEAENADKKRIITKQLLDISGGWKPDWNDYEQKKYYLYYNHVGKTWKADCHKGSCQQQGTIYFPTHFAAGQALSLLDLDWLLL